MARVPSTRRARGAGLLVTAMLAAIPGVAAANDEEPLVLAHSTLATMVADLDADGEREVVAVRRHPADVERIVVEAWGMVGGGWRSLGSSTLERWDDEAGA